jgi:hypothetical protein
VFQAYLSFCVQNPLYPPVKGNHNVHGGYPLPLTGCALCGRASQKWDPRTSPRVGGRAEGEAQARAERTGIGVVGPFNFVSCRLLGLVLWRVPTASRITRPPIKGFLAQSMPFVGNVRVLDGASARGNVSTPRWTVPLEIPYA